ncbi:cupin fold metalloprotein, WbuC family [Candidatus Woesearchaeota archaeon]|nr:cupin fold metalloprotein, WbuC family [Candidatus Woesearchaeota archaeon]
MGINVSNILKLEPNILKELFEKAKISDRKRAFYLLRSSDKGEIPAVMFNVLLPGTYVRPHKHPMNDGREIVILILGKMKVIIFNDDGTFRESYILSSLDTVFVEIPAQTYHTIITLEPSVLCELYLGKYNPTTYREFAEWAPEENDMLMNDYLKKINKITYKK